MLAVGAVEADQMSDARHAGLHLGGLSAEARVIEQPGGADVVQVGDVGVERVAGIHRDPHRARAPEAQQADQHRGVVGRQDGDRVLMLRAGAGHGPRQGMGQGLDLGVGLPAVPVRQDLAVRMKLRLLVEIVDGAHRAPLA